MKTKGPEKVTNEEVLKRVGKKKTNWIGNILRRNYLLHNAIEEHITEGKVVVTRKTLFLDLRNKIYC